MSHGNCPHCNADLNGGSIWQAFMDKTGDEAEADRIAQFFGATRTTGQWGRQIALYDRETDRTLGIKCPDCGQTWSI